MQGAVGIHEEAADVRKRRRFRARFPLAYGASYLLDGVLLALFAAVGTVGFWVPLGYTAAGCASAAIFYWLLITGRSESRRDPFLMLPQVCVSLAVMFASLACAPEVGFFFLGTTFVVMGFGSLQIRWRATGALWAVTAAATGLILYRIGAQVPLLPSASAAERALEWLWFCLTLGRSIALGLMGSEWRLRAHKRQQEVREVLERLEASTVELRLAHARNAAMLSAVPDALLRVDARGAVIELRLPGEFRAASHWPGVGELFTRHLPSEAGRRLEEAVQRARASGVDEHVEFSVDGHGEQPAFFEARFSRIDADETLGLVRDITERKQAEARVARLAYFDSLTGLPNRVAFMDRLGREVRRAARGRQRFGLLFLDLDGFKQINDTLGHNCGDQVLRMAAERLRNALRPSDAISRAAAHVAERSMARLGGDEFTLLILGIQHRDDVLAVARRVSEAMRRPFELDSRELAITCSIGAAVYPDDGDNALTLLQHADTAMYHAKRSGRDNSQLYCASLTEQAFDRLELDNNLRVALARGEFSLRYQPLVEAATGQMVAVEALIRWEHPVRGTISPLDFIPRAEELGLVSAIGDWVLQTACADLERWRQQGLQLRVAVNLSPKQFNRPDLAQSVLEVMAARGLSPGELELEITEGAVLENFTATIAALDALRKRGVRIALDDFGTGYSSLSYLLQIPIDVIKVDRSFVARMAEGGLGASIVHAILALARTLGIGATAEGVETLEQALALRAMACKYLQGYYFSEPVSAQRIVELARRSWSLSGPDAPAPAGRLPVLAP